MKDKRIHNSGFSLVEILLVIFILSIVVAFTSVSISLIYSRDAEKCVKIINSGLETTRMSSLAQEGDFYLLIDAANHTMTIESSKDGVVMEEKLPNKVVLSVTSQGGTAITGDSTKIEFDKSSGKVKEVIIDGLTVNWDDYYAVKISAVTNATGKKASVMVIKMTGKHYVIYGE